MLKLLLAIMAVESGGDNHAVGDNGRAIGCLQIHKAVVEDVNLITGSDWVWPGICRDRNRSFQIAETYLHYWATKKHGAAFTDEQAARIWNGGPNGASKKSTRAYWLKVKAQIQVTP